MDLYGSHRVMLLATVLAVWPGMGLIADEDLQSQTFKRTAPLDTNVDFSVVVTAPPGAKKLQVWFPVPQSDKFQEVRNSRFSTYPVEASPTIASEPEFGNRFAYFEFTNPQSAIQIRHRFHARTWQTDWNVDPHAVRTMDEWPEQLRLYLSRPNPLEDDPKYAATLASLSRGRMADADRLVAALDWTTENLQYSSENASLRADAQHAFTQRMGHCSDFHGLCATMGRSFGYPTRVAYGIHLFAKPSPSHCKLEAFLPPYGWVSFDVSETHKMIRNVQQNSELTVAQREKLVSQIQARMRRGFRDNTWLKVTHGTNFHLAPRASRRAPLIREIYAEADGKPLPDGSDGPASWVTLHRYDTDHQVRYPFTDLDTLGEAD